MRDRDCGGHTAKILRNCRKSTNFAPKNASPTLRVAALSSHEVAFNNLGSRANNLYPSAWRIRHEERTREVDDE